MPKVCSKCKVGTDFAKGQSWCKDCQKEYRKLHSSRHKKYIKTWRGENGEYDKERYTKKTFGISRREYDMYFLDASCGICERRSNLVLDHDHDTGEIRGVLCATCNSGIGMLQDNEELCIKGAEWIKKGGKI